MLCLDKEVLGFRIWDKNARLPPTHMMSVGSAVLRRHHREREDRLMKILAAISRYNLS